MNMTQFAISNKRVTTVALIIILFAGLSTYKSMPRAEDPGFIVRTAMVTTIFPGASPERIEMLITDKLEKVIQEMPEIDFISSSSKPGISVIYVNIKESYKKMRPIWDSLRRKINAAAPNLPEGVIGPFINDEFGDVFGTIITITGEGYTDAELKEIADDTRNELLLIEEVAKVEIIGVQEERVFVEYNNAKLAELGVSPYQLQRILQDRNIIFPGGQLFTENEQIVLEPSGNFESIEELKRTVIKLPDRNNLLYLGDLAEVSRSYIDPPTSKITYNGKSAIGLAISLRKDGNIIALGEEVKKKVAWFQEIYPIGVEFDFVVFQSFYVNKKVTEFTRSLIQAVIIVMLVMLITLGIRTGLVVASLIPMAMFMAIFIMGIFGIGLDQMSLASLIIALGMLVDNSIVMSESIMIQMAEGKERLQAAIDSAKELKIPLLTSSLTTAAAFLTIFLAESTTGEYTAPLFKVVTITLLSSWILTLTMIPLFCFLFLKVKPKKSGDAFNSRFYRDYRRGLLALVRYPLLSIIGAIVIFVGVMSLFRFVPAIFFPENDKPNFFAELKFPVGTPLSKTVEMIKKVDEFIEAELMADAETGQDGIINWASFCGAGPPRFQLSYNPEPTSPEYAYILLNTTSYPKIKSEFVPKLEKFCLDNFPDLITNIRLLFLGPPVVAPIQIRISGKDTDEIFDWVDKFKNLAATIPGLKNIRDDWGPRSKKLMVKINQARAQRAGLTSRDIATSLQTVLSGIEVTDYRESDEVIPVTLRLSAADRKDIGKLDSHNIYVQMSGQAVPLKQVADIEVVWQPGNILRRDRLQTVTINIDVEAGANAIAISGQLEELLAKEEWPIGYKYEQGGELESSGKAQDSIGAKLPIAGLIIILLLVSQFDSIRRPAIIMLTIPFGLIGVTIGFLLTGQAFGFMALLGVVSLSGIVINNAIVLIDRIKIEIEENGLEPARAIIESAQRRLRPILLTTVTTIGGLLPLWFGGGALFESMAVAIIFGLLFATVLTLGFVPVLYSIFFRVKFKDFRWE